MVQLVCILNYMHFVQESGSETPQTKWAWIEICGTDSFLVWALYLEVWKTKVPLSKSLHRGFADPHVKACLQKCSATYLKNHAQLE